MTARPQIRRAQREKNYFITQFWTSFVYFYDKPAHTIRDKQQMLCNWY